MQKEHHLHNKKVIIILLVFLGIVAVVAYSTYVNAGNMEKQIEQNLEDVAQQNALVLYTKIHEQHGLIQSLAKELEGVTPDTIEETLGRFEIFMEAFHLKRFAYCFPDGTTYSTDGDITDLSYREFYQQGMDGKNALTGVLSDALRQEHDQVNVMTVPVKEEDGSISGVFGLAYDTEAFNESMQIESFGGEGCSFAVNENGQLVMVTGNCDLVVSDNLFEVLLQGDVLNEPILSELQQRIEQGQVSSGVLYLSEQYYYYGVPVSMMDGDVSWYVLTMIPSTLFEARINEMKRNQYIMSILVVTFIVIGAVLIIMELLEQNKKMFRLAYEDAVTGGANYEKFCKDMENRAGRGGYLVSMEIMNFSNIAIASGKKAGNIMIRETWDMIEESLGSDELAGHVKNDKFLLFLTAEDDEQLKQRLEALTGRIGQKAGDFNVFGLRAVWGVYKMPGQEAVEVAYSKAWAAREYVPADRDFVCAFYNEADNRKMQREKELEERLPAALEQKEFEVWYQPKYSAKDCALVGSEALVRWRDRDGQLISPGSFIPLFEKNGMIMKVDEYMFRSVCVQQKQWMAEGRKVYPVSVNISRASLHYRDVVQRYREILQESGISPEYIQLEITETVVEGRRDVCELLNEFRDFGVKILMDDFGTGASSLATLSSQCFDTVKLDKSLVDHIGDKGGEIMLYHIVSMGQALGLHITAEGVEKETQVEFLRDLKCDDIQGFYFAKPMPAEEYEKMLQ